MKRAVTAGVVVVSLVVISAIGNASCTGELAYYQKDVPARAGDYEISVQAPLDCSWTAQSDCPWVTILGCPYGCGPGNAHLQYHVDENTGASRECELTIAGRVFTVNQAAAEPGPCAYSISPSDDKSIPASGTTGDIQVTVDGSGCSWTATSNKPSWLHVTSGDEGTESGTVSYKVDPNSGEARDGTLSIAGRSFYVSQVAGDVGSCTFSISPSQVTNVSPDGATGEVSVTVTGNGCSWDATSNDKSWLHITSGDQGTTSGVVKYLVDPNTGASRSGKLSIAGKTFAVSQKGACPCSLYPGQRSGVPADGATGTVYVKSSCSWAAQSAAGWILLDYSHSGNGDGSFGYTITPNTSGQARNGAVTVGGAVFSVYQDAAWQADTSKGGVVNTASCGWVDTGLTVSTNDRVRVVVTGTGQPGGNGKPADDNCYLAPGLPQLSLVGRVGSGSAFLVGSGYSFVAQGSGQLYLGVNASQCVAGSCGGVPGSWSYTAQLDYSNMAPVIAMSAQPRSGFCPLVVSFSSAGTHDPDGQIAEVTWSFGDGSPHSHSADGSHTYAASGTYVLALSAVDNAGKTSSAEVTIAVDARERKWYAYPGSEKDHELTVTASGEPTCVAITNWHWVVTCTQAGVLRWTRTSDTVEGSTKFVTADWTSGVYGFRVDVTYASGSTVTGETTYYAR